MEICRKCFYSFETGDTCVCANHCNASIDSSCPDIQENFDGLSLDSYGIDIKYIDFCDGFREDPSFLSNQ